MARSGHRASLAGRPDRRHPRDPGDLRVQPSPPQLQLLRRLVERAATSAGDLLVGGRAARVRRRPVLAGPRRDPRLGGAVDRQLDLRLPRVPARGLALPAAARGQGRHGAARRPVRDPPGADVAGVPRHDAGLPGGHARRPGRRVDRRRGRRDRTRRGGARAGRGHPDVPLRAHQAARPVHGPGAVELVAAPQLLRRDLLLVRPRPLRSGGVALGLVVGLPRHHRDGRALPRREHPDDGAAQPRAASGVPGRHRPGAPARPASPRNKQAPRRTA